MNYNTAMLHRLLVGALLLGLVLAASVRAQDIRLPHVATGAPKTIVLPKIVVAGARATLAVLDAKGELVPAADVDLSTGVKVSTDDFGRASFAAPARTGLLTAKSTETGASATAAVIAPLNDTSATTSVAFPNYIVMGQPFAVFSGSGPNSGFSGDANLDQLALGNLPALILAASPVSLVALPNPHISTGLTSLSAGLVSRKPDPQRVTVISLEVTSAPEGVAAGTRSTLVIRVFGSPERFNLQVRNLTPKVIEFAHGAAEHVVSSGGAANFATVTFTAAKAGGDYMVSTSLEPYVDAAALAAARDEVLAAEQIAGDAGWLKRLQRLVQEMDSSKEHSLREIARFRQEIEKMMGNKPPKAVAEFLGYARESLSAGTS